MNNDYSWLGLYRKGYKLQIFIDGKWQNLKYFSDIAFAYALKHKIRYKHSIQ